MKHTFLLLPALLLMSGACATRTTTNVAPIRRGYSPVCLEGVAVFNDFSSVPYDYREVAYITAEQNPVYTDSTQMVNAMRKRAGEQGGNALVLNSIHNDKSTVKLIGEALGTGSADQKGKAVAIYMPADSARVKDACGRS